MIPIGKISAAAHGKPKDQDVKKWGKGERINKRISPFFNQLIDYEMTTMRAIKGKHPFSTR